VASGAGALAAESTTVAAMVVLEGAALCVVLAEQATRLLASSAGASPARRMVNIRWFMLKCRHREFSANENYLTNAGFGTMSGGGQTTVSGPEGPSYQIG